MIIKAYAKINLSLDVIRRREDGYHDLEMIMAPLEFHDTVSVEIADKDEFTWNLDTEIKGNNTIVKAVELMRKTFQLKTCFKIHVEKRIPMEAGLAGGSSNAAAVMSAIRTLCKCEVTIEELSLLGKQIGADVPFCIIAKPAHVKGIGEKIEPFTMKQDYDCLLVKPQRGVSTKLAFELLDFEHCEHPNTQLVKDSLMKGDFKQFTFHAKNTLEQTAFQLVPEIKEIKESLLQDGFDFVLMSGSGSCLFAITQDKNLLQEAIRNVKYLSCFKEITKIRK